MPSATIRGLVLDPQHRVLVDERGALPALEADRPERPLLAFQRFARDVLRLELPAAAGSWQPGDRPGAQSFSFFVEPSSAPAASRWLPIARAAENDEVWRTYVRLVLCGWEPPTRQIEVFGFGGLGEMASRLVHVVATGTKRATTCWLRAAELAGETLPAPGSVSIVTDGFGFPRCAIRAEEVERLPFCQVDARWAALEGEGDLTLEDWREGHRRFFDDEGARLGIAFNDDEIVLMERFSVIWWIGDLGLPA